MNLSANTATSWKLRRAFRELLRLAVPSGIAIVALSGCTESATLPTSPAMRAPSGFTIAVTLPSGRPKTQDEIFAEIAAHVPGYAGTYYDDDGTPVTSLVDLASGPAAEQAIAPIIRSGKNGKGPSKSRFKKVAYDFIKLKEWKDDATRTLFARQDVVFVDIDERNNRLSIGVDNPTETGPTESFLRDRHIPGVVAVMMPIDTSNRPPITAGPEETLRNTQSLYGGVSIDLGATKICSLGFNTMLTAGNQSWYQTTYSYDHYFVTAAHCMGSVGYMSGTTVFRNSTSRSQVIGYEYRQPDWAGHERYDSCPAGYRCSLADAALVRYVVPWGGARIGRTTFPGAYSDTGSVTIDPYAPAWTVADSVSDYTLLSGRVINKVGRSSGWTQGYVTETCADYRLIESGAPSNLILLCSWSASFTSIGGDSGGPVFVNKFGSYPQQQLVGTVWAGIYGVSTFSFYPYISYELTDRDTQVACGGVVPCWPRLSVSGF